MKLALKIFYEYPYILQQEIIRKPSPYPSNCTDGKGFTLDQEGNYTTTVE